MILPATTPAHLADFAVLCREYAASLPFSLCFQGFEQEMAELPGKYAPPAGVILLAYQAGLPAGCVAMRSIANMPGDAGPVCEMKRMFVRPECRGRGIGRELAVRLLEAARSAGYQTMKLDSEDTFTEAVTLYRSLGFADCPRYNDDPHPHTVWMKKALSEPDA